MLLFVVGVFLFFWRIPLLKLKFIAILGGVFSGFFWKKGCNPLKYCSLLIGGAVDFVGTLPLTQLFRRTPKDFSSSGRSGSKGISWLPLMRSCPSECED
jgi:hypothetical protein